MKTIREEQPHTEPDHANPVNKGLVVVNGGNNSATKTNQAQTHNGVVDPASVANHAVFRKILPGEPTTRKVLSKTKRNKASSQPPIAEELQANFE